MKEINKEMSIPFLKEVIILSTLRIVLCENIYRIADESSFSSFISDVNSGTGYSGTTVYLDADLSLSSYSSLNPIGINPTYQFLGTFDGQGYIISGLTINSSLQYVGLFGCSTNSSIKNVVMDSSCSVMSSYTSSNFCYVGGIIGWCESSNGNCNIGNCVNMGNISFSGDVSGKYHLFVGGIAGNLYSYSTSYSCTVRNCVNYGSIEHSGACSTWGELGGIAGLLDGPGYKFVQNCINYGSITHSGTSNYPALGGIAAVSWKGTITIENCVSAGQVTMAGTSLSMEKYIGSIVGYINSVTYNNYCYYTINVGVSSLNGTGSLSSTTGSSTSPVSVDSSLVSSLNSQATDNGWNKWLFNSDSKNVTFKVNNNNGFFFSSQIILLPDLASDSLVFSGWYADSLFKSTFSSSSVSSDTTLYGGWLVCVTFNTNEGGGNVPTSKDVVYNCAYGDLPTPSRIGYNFSGWHTATSGGTEITKDSIVIIVNNHELYAHWTPLTFTVNFDKNNGDSVSKTEMTVTYDSAYGDLATTSRTGYNFTGWFSEITGGSQIKDDIIVKTPNDHTLYAHWTPLTYTVKFDKNGGDSVSEESITVTYDSVYGTLPTATKAGNAFDGWHDSTNGGNKVEPITKVTITSDQTLYAHWNANGYTVYFNGNGGIASRTSIIVTFEEKYGELATATRDGYDFKGWFSESTGGTQYTKDSTVEITATQTLYAHWEVRTFTVKFEGNGADSVSKTEMTVTYDSAYGDLATTSRTGYNFTGWFSEITGGSQIKDNIIVKTPNDHELYAHWTPLTFTVNFDKNNGDSVSKTEMTVTYDSAYGELATTTRTGYNFTGWFSAVTGGTEYTKDSTVKITATQTLYAHWTPLTFTVYFSANGGESVSEESITVTYDSAYGELPTATRTGYKLAGWFSAATGGTQTANDSIVEIIATQTLYAHWTPNNYTVYFNANGGSGNAPASKNVIFNSAYGDLPTPSREGHTFTGWFSETPGGSFVSSSTIVSFAYDHTIYAHWNPIQYTISFILNDEGDCDNTTQDYDSLISFPKLSKTGYTFICWCSDPSLTIEYTAKRVESKNVKLYAKWEANNYTVLFDSKGGGPVNSIVVTYGKKYSNLPSSSKKRNIFLWWEMNETGQRVWNNTVVETAHNHTLYAVWKTNVVTLDMSRGGISDLASVDATYGKNYGILPTPTRIGYTFAGWFFNETSTEQITNKTNVTIPYPHTLYARWKINNYMIIFNPGNGENVVEKTLEYNSTVAYPDNPEKRGYTFLGWDNNTLGFMPAENITLTALWEANNYTVTLDVNGADYELDNKEMPVTFNTSYGTLPTPSRIGHAFAGWTDSLFGGNDVISSTLVSISDNHTLYALWTVNQYTLSFMFEGGEPINITLNYNDLITYPNENPSRSFHKFRRWCTRGDSGEEECNITHVPDHNLTFTASFDVDSSLVTGIASAAFAVILLIIFIVVIVFLIRVTRTVKHEYEVVGIEMDEDLNERKGDIEERIRQQIEATSISVNVKKKLEKPLKKADRNKGVEEILMDLEVDCENAEDISIIDSYRATNASVVVADAINNEKNLITAAEYLALLYYSVRGQEEYEKFSELYFGMKSVDGFLNSMDEKTISFGGIVSGFTSKKVAIQSLIPKEEEETTASMPSGILFRVQNGMGYKIGKVNKETDEVLFELGSSFKVESIKEINKDKYVIVNLSFVSPLTKDKIMK